MDLKFSKLIEWPTFPRISVRDIKIEKSEKGSRFSDFDNVMEKTLPMTRGSQQNEQLANYKFSAQHIKITIFSGYVKKIFAMAICFILFTY